MRDLMPENARRMSSSTLSMFLYLVERAESMDNATLQRHVGWNVIKICRTDLKQEGKQWGNCPRTPQEPVL